MEISKNLNDNNRYELILSNEFNDKFLIHFAGGDLYWTMLDYHDNNEFTVTRSDKVFFEYLDNIFNEINSNKRYSNVINNNIFKWYSEAYGLYENANNLNILRDTDKYIINFYQNPTKMVFRKDLCTICFCLSGSRFQDIANMFSNMFYALVDNDKKVLKRKNTR